MSGIYTETVIAGMNYDSDSDEIKQMSFFVPIVDELSGHDGDAVVSLFLTKNVDLVNFIYRLFLGPGWCET